MLQWLLELEDARQQGKVGCEEIVNAIINTRRAPTSSLASNASTLSPSLLQVYGENSPNYFLQDNSSLSSGLSAPFFGYEELEFDWLFNSIAL